MAGAAQISGQALLRCGPPVFAASNDYERMRLENCSERFQPITAQVHGNMGFYPALACDHREAAVGEIGRGQRFVQRQGIRNNLSDNQRYAPAEVTRQNPSLFQRRQSRFDGCKDDGNVQAGFCVFGWRMGTPHSRAQTSFYCA